MTVKTNQSMMALAIFTLMLCASNPIGAQKPSPDLHIFGHVVDKSSREHLPFVNIQLFKAEDGDHRTQVMGTSTDESGHYYLSRVPAGRYIIAVSMVGYKKYEQQLNVRSPHSQEVNIILEPDITNLQDVTVSALRYETDRLTSATIVGVLSTEIMERTNSANLAEGLVYQPGLRVENTCQNCGASSVRINGLDGKYSQILIDGRPVFSSLAGVYGLEQIPTSMIDRVEVIRGGGSSLFGANAIGGVINVITREPLFNTLDISHTTNNMQGKAWDNVTSLNASFVSVDNRAGAYIFGTHRSRQGYDHDGDGFTELGGLRNTSLGLRSYYRITNHAKLSLEYHNTYEFRRGGDSINLQPHLSSVAEQAEHHVNGGSFSFDYLSSDNRACLSVFTSMQHIDRRTYYGTQYDINAFGYSTDLSSVSGSQFNYSFDRLLLMPSQLIAGIEYSYNSLKDEQIAYHRNIKQDIHIASAFLQNEWKNEKLGLLIGARADKHNLMEKVVVSPRANLRYNFTPAWVGRLSYSSGFRAPQAFDEDLHIMAVGGDVAIISLDPNLQPEYSGSTSASLGWNHLVGQCDIGILVEGFYSNINNIFILRENGRDDAGNLLLERTNGSGAFVAGINFELSAKCPNSLTLQAGLTAQRSRYKEPEIWSENSDIAPQTRMFRTPDIYGYLTANYTFFRALEAALSCSYTGPMLVQHFAGYIAKDQEVVTPSFFDMSIKLSYDWEIASATILQLNGGIQNILNSYQDDFDQGPNRDAGYIYGPNRPRTLFFGVKISL